MELVYLWLEDYKNIKNQGFNFSPKFKCEYKDGNLTINSREHIENLFGKNINITAIVGENGSGKSNILDLLFYNNTTNHDIDDGCYFVISYESEIVLYYFKFGNCNQIIKKDKPQKDEPCVFNIEEVKNDGASKKDIEDYTRIFYSTSPVVETPTSKFSHDLSLKDTERYKDKRLESVENALNMIKSDVKFENLFELPTKLCINVKENEIKENDVFLDKMKEIDKNYNDSTLELSFLEEVTRNILYSLYKHFKKIKCLKNVEENINNNSVNAFSEMLEYSYCDSETMFKEDIENFINEVKKSKLKQNSEISIDSVTKEFLNSYRKLLEHSSYKLEFDILSFKWSPNLSSGQETYMFQFADFYKVMPDKQKDELLILIDEGENTLHPRWQKQYIKLLVDFFKDNFSGKKIHIILATHSPFILSDLPKENVIFLKKDSISGNCINDTKNTNINPFGANIHTLLSDGFFMDGGLMGEFAKGKIQDVINFINDKKSNLSKEEIYPIIELIGEPFLQQKLKEQYFNKYPEERNIDNEIDILEKKLEKLKNAKNSK